MKKVVYSVTKYVGDKFTKLSGIGCINTTKFAFQLFLNKIRNLYCNFKGFVL